MTTETQEPKITKEELLAKLYNTHIDEADHRLLRHEIQAKYLGDEKYMTRVICFRSSLHPDVRAAKDPYSVLRVPGIQKLDRTSDKYGTGGIVVPLVEYEGIKEIFKKDRTFVEDPQFVTMPRHDAEYNLQYRQLVVGAFIKSQDEIMLLKTNSDSTENRITDKYTLIQGHVDFSPEAYLMSQQEFLYENIRREFHEELNVDDKVFERKLLSFEPEPRFVICDNDDFVGMEHYGVIYQIDVATMQSIKDLITTGEASKHEVVTLPLKGIEAYYDKMDSWTRMIVQRIKN